MPKITESAMKINDDVMKILANSQVEDNKLFLPIQLDRKLYVSTNKILEELGGKWNRKAKAHLFETSPEDMIQEIIMTGEFEFKQKIYQFFPTPPELAKRMVDLADIRSGERCLEPSAGTGNIARFLPAGTDCIELMPENRTRLKEENFNLVWDDFMSFPPDSGPYDVIIANPPFSRQQDLSHITKMIAMAKRCVIAVASASVLYRENQKTRAFRDLVAEFNGQIDFLPENSFKNSGTMIRTVLIQIFK